MQFLLVNVFNVDKFRFIVRMTLNGTKEINVVYYGTSSQVNGITYDWISGMLTCLFQASYIKERIPDKILYGIEVSLVTAAWDNIHIYCSIQSSSLM